MSLLKYWVWVVGEEIGSREAWGVTGDFECEGDWLLEWSIKGESLFLRIQRLESWKERRLGNLLGSPIGLICFLELLKSSRYFSCLEKEVELPFYWRIQSLLLAWILSWIVLPCRNSLVKKSGRKFDSPLMSSILKSRTENIVCLLKILFET